MTKSPKTYVYFLLDRTFSMGAIKPQTVSGFNEYLGTLKKDPKGIRFTLLQFCSTGTDVVHAKAKLKDVPQMALDDFKPEGTTPLIDAAMHTIALAEKQTADKPDAKVVVCFQTDGEENCSHEHSWMALNTKIAEMQKKGWQFNFMGAGIDAYKQSARMGLSAGQTVSYDKDDLAATQNAFGASAMNTTEFKSGLRDSTIYSAMQKQSAKDAFDPDNEKGKPLSKSE